MIELGSPRHLLDMGLLMAETDPGAAEAAFQLAIESGSQDWGSRAAYALASLYQRHGNLPGALRMFEVATVSPDEETAALAREAVRSLGDVQAELVAGMEPAEAAFTEGCHLRAAGDLAGAVAAFERCMATEDVEFAPYAACQLGAILAAEEDFENAKPALRLAVRSGHAVYAPVSAYVLAEILLDEGDRAGARELLAVAVAHPDPATADNAAALLARLRAEGD